MTIKFKVAALAAASLAVAGVSPAMAQSRLGVAVANVEQAVFESNAYTTARTQMQTTYKAQIDQFNARNTALNADLQAKQTALQTALQAANNQPTPAIQTQYEAFQKAQNDARAELERLGQPIQIAQAYVEEQIGLKLSDAIKAAMTAAKVDLVLKPDATVSYQPSVDITAQVKAQINTLVPSVSITPPAGWRPGGQQQGAAAAPAAAPAPAAAQPAKPKGR
jgi:Skp family chaperone for outer membrane proteins